jgi:hypothetical protein
VSHLNIGVNSLGFPFPRRPIEVKKIPRVRAKSLDDVLKKSESRPMAACFNISDGVTSAVDGFRQTLLGVPAAFPQFFQLFAEFFFEIFHGMALLGFYPMLGELNYLR